MGKQVLLNARYFVGAADLTGQSNKVEWENSFEEKETTNFGSGGAKEVIGGVESVILSAEGQWEAGDPGKIDNQMWADKRLIEPHTLGPNTATAGTLANLTQALRHGAKLFGAIGDVAPWALNATGSWPMAEGVFVWAPGTPITADTASTAFQLGALGAGERLYASMHVLSVAGTNTPELDVFIESDSVEAFSGTPESRIVFSTATAVGGQIKRTSKGPHTDTWYRASIGVTDNGGTGMSFLAVIAVGIA